MKCARDQLLVELLGSPPVAVAFELTTRRLDREITDPGIQPVQLGGVTKRVRRESQSLFLGNTVFVEAQEPQLRQATVRPRSFLPISMIEIVLRGKPSRLPFALHDFLLQDGLE